MSAFIERWRNLVEADPGATSLIDEAGSTWSRQDLHQRSLKIAHAVRGAQRDLQLGPEPRVGLLIPRSREFVAALLGIWEADAAFVPLDPSLPPLRLAGMCEQAGIRVVICSGATAPLAATLGLDAAIDPAPLPAVPRAMPPRPHRDDRLAWVIFTSGSTGAPKGVAVEHRGLVPMLDAQIEAFGLDPLATAVAALSTSFDASISDIGTALLSGARLLVPPATTDPVDLPALLTRHGVTHADLPPALLSVLPPDVFPASLQTVIVGGEPSDPAVLGTWARTRRLINVYGPTEATVCVSLCQVDAETWRRPLLGRPIAGTRFDVVDERLEPVPDGAIGELLITGPLLARGYVNAADLESERFIQWNGERGYLTGDRVQRDGADLVFCGRVDRQIKLNGRLIAPEEVEAALTALPSIRRAVVLKRGRNLVACVERAGAPVRAQALRSMLEQQLPAWMVPAHIEVRDALPLTASGKPDLAALEEEMTIADVAGVARRVLGHVVAADETFESLGIDSLDRLELLVACEAAGLDVPTEALAPTATLGSVAGASPTGMAMSQIRSRVAAYPVVTAGSNGIRKPSAPRRLLLTGATGHLGGHLLKELLAGSDVQVVCLVRAESDARAAARLGATSPGRVEVLAGDCTLPQLGLRPAAWHELAEGIDAIVHCAARVHALDPWEQLEAANVQAVQHILELAHSGRPKAIHHASTLSVFVSSDRHTGAATEADTLDQTRWVHGGYAQTKVAAELLLRRAADANHPVALHRLGLITGTSSDGAASPHDFLSMFFRGIASIGAAPRDLGGIGVDVTPVDWCARAMAALVRQPLRRAQTTWHLAGACPVSAEALLEAMLTIGHPIRRVSADEFLTMARAANRADPVSAPTALALCRALPGAAFERHRAMDLFQTTDIVFDATRAQAVLTPLGLHRPAADAALLARYARHALEGQVSHAA